VPVSGSGFADDLASLGSFFAEGFMTTLITVADQLDAVDPATIATASAYLEAGGASRDAQQWQAAVQDFTRAVSGLERELVFGPPPCQ
jgi:hypothetical protein